jgi:hypothetical protein
VLIFALTMLPLSLCCCVACHGAAGCWKDEFVRAVPTLLLASPSMTVDMCAQLAYASRCKFVVILCHLVRSHCKDCIRISECAWHHAVAASKGM